MTTNLFSSPSVRRYQTIYYRRSRGEVVMGRFTKMWLVLSALVLTLFQANILRGQTPGGINTNLKAWYKADAGASATTWANQVTNAALPTLAKAGAGTITVKSNNFNFNPSLAFSNAYFGTGSTNNVPMAALTNGTRIAAYVVGKTSVGGVVVGFQDQTSSTNKFAFENNGFAYYGTTSTFTTFPNTGLMATMPTLATASFGTSQSVPFTNGTTGTTVSSTNNTSTSRTFNLMSFRNGEFMPTGDLAEVIIYDATHTQAEREKVQTYLGIKYGITLSHNYQNSAGTIIYNVATMPFDIAGIGQDNGSGLLQKQSAAVADTALQIALTAFAGSNQANSNVFAADQSFMIWGHNGLSKTRFANLLSNDKTLSRMARTWKIQETATIGTTRLRFLNTVNTFLIVSTDSSFATYTKINMTPNGGFYEADFDFANGQYFTFAQVVPRAGGVVGASLWLKADAGITKTGANVTQWADQSNSGFITTQAAKAATANVTHVTAAINYNPSVRFDGAANQRLTGAATANFTGAGTYLAIANIRANTIANASAIMSNSATGGQGLIIQSGGTAGPFYLLTDGSGASDANSANSANIFSSFAQSRLVRGVYSGAGTSTQNTQLYLDGGVLGENYTAAGVSVSLGSGFEIGGRTAGGQTARIWNGDIGEVIYYPSVLSATDLEKVESYLAIKYGITLGGNGSATAKYVNSDGMAIWAANTGFHHDVTGMGLDSLSTLDQKQATNTNATNWVSMANTAFAADNATNINGFGENKSFLIWGHDGGATAFTAIAGTGLQVVGRKWRAQETGTVNPAQIRIPNSAATLASGEKLILIASTDATIGTNDLRIDMTLNGSNYECEHDFPTGISYFSFAKVQTTEGGLCNDGIDNDADGTADCDDADCGAGIAKIPAIRH